jgi:formylglycine-generating enzyme required for sulfatase activity
MTNPKNLTIYLMLDMLLIAISSCGYDPLASLSAPDAANQSPIDAPTQFSSCADLPKTCGAAYESCCQTAMVPGTDSANTFYRGYDVAGDMMFVDSGYPAKVSTFILDRYEVTVGRFRAFVNAGMGTQANPPKTGSGIHPKLENSGWDRTWNENLATDSTDLVKEIKCSTLAQQHTWTDSPGLNENVPINCVTWYEAMAFCIWDGGYLPTATEWNYAASGGSEQRAFPWSNPPDSLAIGCNYINYYPCNIYKPGPVGGKSPAGDDRWSHADMAGNLLEWVLDWNAPLSQTAVCDDCANLTPSSERAIRGGYWSSSPSEVRAAFVGGVSISGGTIPNRRYIADGLRCARNAP